MRDYKLLLSWSCATPCPLCGHTNLRMAELQSFQCENRNTGCLKEGKTNAMHTVLQLLLDCITSVGHFFQLARRLCTMSCIVCRGVIMQQPLIKNCSLHRVRILLLIMQLFQWKWLLVQVKGTHVCNNASRAVALPRHYRQPYQGAIFSCTYRFILSFLLESVCIDTSLYNIFFYLIYSTWLPNVPTWIRRQS